MPDDGVCACALKRVPYDTPDRRDMVNAELAALKDIAGKPGVVQCLGIYGDWDTHTGQECLWIVMKCVLPNLFVSLLLIPSTGLLPNPMSLLLSCRTLMRKCTCASIRFT